MQTCTHIQMHTVAIILSCINSRVLLLSLHIHLCRDQKRFSFNVAIAYMLVNMPCLPALSFFLSLSDWSSSLSLHFSLSCSLARSLSLALSHFLPSLLLSCSLALLLSCSLALSLSCSLALSLSCSLALFLSCPRTFSLSLFQPTDFALWPSLSN